MANNKRVLINAFGDSKEAFALNGSTKSENAFFWNKNIKNIELLLLKEERRVHKVNSLKSKYSKTDFSYWKQFVLSTKKYVKVQDLKLRASLYKKGEITLDIVDDDTVEVYATKNLETARNVILENTEKQIVELEKMKTIITDIKAGKAEDKAEQLKEQKELAKVLVEAVKAEARKLLELNNLIADVKDTSTEASKDAEIFNELKEAYKAALPEYKKAAKEKANDFPLVENSYDPKLFFKTRVKRDVYNLELAKNELEFLEKLSKYDWDFDFRYANAQETIETLPSIIKLKVDRAAAVSKAYSTYKEAAKASKEELEPIKSKVKEIKLVAKENVKSESAKLKMSGANKSGFKTKKKEIRHNKRMEIRKAKLANEKKFLWGDWRFEAAQASQTITREEKVYHSNLQEIKKAKPVEISKVKYFGTIAASVAFPGLNSLINRQWIKGLIQSVGTIIIILMLAWSLGGFPSAKGNGVIGLGTLGAENGVLVNGNDSRFYLVMGTIGIIFIAAAIFYWLVSVLNAINVANLARAGVRYANWRDTKKLLKTAGLPYLLSAPALIFILFIVVLPLLATLLLSFTNFNQRVYIPDTGKHIVLNGVTHPFAWVGGQQYHYITQVVGKDFSRVLLWTILWTIFATCLTIFLGTLLAILVNQNRIKGKTFFRIIYILPWAIPAFITILFFSIFFAHDGIFNNTIGTAIFGRSIDWKNEATQQKALLIFMQGWLGQSYMFLLVTGMLQSIPKSLYEAARVDGSKPMQQFRTITAPIIIMQIAPLLIGQFTFNFNNFGIIYLFNNGGAPIPGQTAGQTDIFLSWIFKMVNNGASSKPGAAAALSLIVSIFVVTPSALVFFRSKSFRGGNF